VAYQTLEIERKGPVLHVWLNRPKRLNAIDPTMLREVGDLFLSLETDFETRVVVLGGRGRSFCAGADRKPPDRPVEDRPAPGDRERRWVGQLGRRACRAIEECEAVTIARVHGHAIGGGACFAVCCDFRIAEGGTVFRVPEVDLGIPLSWGGTPRLIHEIGAARTRELILLCRDVDAATAERWGLVHRVVDAAELDSEVRRWVDEILEKPELAVHMTKTQLRGYARRAALGDETETNGDLITVAMRSPEMRKRFRLEPGQR
jgi:enoyl-CoA hydratase/carnithine racemase